MAGLSALELSGRHYVHCGGDRYYEYKLRYTRPPSPARHPGLTSHTWAKHTHATVEQKHPVFMDDIMGTSKTLEGHGTPLDHPFYTESQPVEGLHFEWKG
ncbi:uncharacterized protein ARMOST_22108 [Armillaria ostoyae]|uniref:Uncharacterized protein n=1 Tax=Armillaria ostoyae TaxID=47428 RepID=A0A284SBZ0_ARMOS|nr:uncharacterized protein ARMOST_22108 [Armillaria ostoyae]